MEFKTFMAQAWQDHADDAEGVALRLVHGRELAAEESDIATLASLAQHVFGEHLGAWQRGMAFLEGFEALPGHSPDGTSGQTLRRCHASLALASGAAGDARAGLSVSDRIRVGAMAAACLAGRDTGRAMQLFQASLDAAQAAGLAATDPTLRALAVTGNSLACALEEQAERSADERALMILAAQAARHFWALAGTWLETERAEYRLAMTWLRAADAARARQHAQACLAIVDAEAGPALERFFAFEAIGCVEKEAGDSGAHAAALARAREAFAALPESNQAWCGASLEKLAA